MCAVLEGYHSKFEKLSSGGKNGEQGKHFAPKFQIFHKKCRGPQFFLDVRLQNFLDLKEEYRNFFPFFADSEKLKSAKIHFRICYMLKNYWICFSKFYASLVFCCAWKSVCHVLGMYRMCQLIKISQYKCRRQK